LHRQGTDIENTRTSQKDMNTPRKKGMHLKKIICTFDWAKVL